MQNTNNELMVVTDTGMQLDFNVSSLTDTSNSILTMFAKGVENDKADVYNAIQAPDSAITDAINTSFKLLGVVCHPVQITNEETGEVLSLPRMVLFTDKGTFGSVSMTLFNSLRNLFAVYGNLTDTNGIDVTLKQTVKGDKRFYSLMVDKKKK